MEKAKTAIDTKQKQTITIKRKKNFSKKPIRVSPYESEIIKIKRVVKVVKGGRRFRFSVLIANGDRKGKVGYGVGKANEIPNAAKKARSKAERNLVNINITKDKSIDFEIVGKFGASQVVMIPAKPGTGIIAGGSVRTVLKLAGIENIYTKAYGSRNKQNLLLATFNGLQKIISPAKINELRSKSSGKKAETKGKDNGTA